MFERIGLAYRVGLLLTLGALLIAGMLLLVGDAHAAAKPPKTKISNPLVGCDGTVTSSLVTALTDYNERATGPRHCE